VGFSTINTTDTADPGKKEEEDVFNGSRQG
jgi:hypothetical protein